MHRALELSYTTIPKIFFTLTQQIITVAESISHTATVGVVVVIAVV